MKEITKENNQLQLFLELASRQAQKKIIWAYHSFRLIISQLGLGLGVVDFLVNSHQNLDPISAHSRAHFWAKNGTPPGPRFKRKHKEIQ